MAVKANRLLTVGMRAARRAGIDVGRRHSPDSEQSLKARRMLADGMVVRQVAPLSRVSDRSRYHALLRRPEARQSRPKAVPC